MTLKERKETKLLMTKILNAAKTIKRDANEFHLHDETFAQMYCLTIFTEKAKVLMDTLKPQEPDDTMQGILLDLDSNELVAGKVVITPNGHEDTREEEVPEDDNVSV